jgi:hypothetical protein
MSKTPVVALEAHYFDPEVPLHIKVGAPATQRMDAETAIPVARRANDKLHELNARRLLKI